MIIYQYRELDEGPCRGSTGNVAEFVAALNKLGENGWRLISHEVHHGTNYGEYYTAILERKLDR